MMEITLPTWRQAAPPAPPAYESDEEEAAAAAALVSLQQPAIHLVAPQSPVYRPATPPRPVQGVPFFFFFFFFETPCGHQPPSASGLLAGEASGHQAGSEARRRRI